MIGNSRTSKMDDFVRLPNHSTVNWLSNRIRRPSYMPRFGYIAGDGTSGFGNRVPLTLNVLLNTHLYHYAVHLIMD